MKGDRTINRENPQKKKSIKNSKSSKRSIKEKILNIISEIGEAFRWGFPFK